MIQRGELVVATPKPSDGDAQKTPGEKRLAGIVSGVEPPPADPSPTAPASGDGTGGGFAKLVDNERLKLLANALDRASTSCFTVGIVTPFAGWLYNVSGLNALPWWWLLSGFAGWLVAAVALHRLARRTLGGLLP